jgi:actin-related protein
VEGQDVVVIHPGSRFLRIGRASDSIPRTVPHVIARRTTAPVPATCANKDLPAAMSDSVRFSMWLEMMTQRLRDFAGKWTNS